MKSALAFVLIASLLAFTHAFPGAIRDSAESTEVDEKQPQEGVVLVMPRRNIFDDFGDDDDDDSAMPPSIWHPFRFDTNPFNDFITRMQDTMNRMKAQMAAALAGQLGQSGITPWGKIPEGANTTSTTKIIGDHAVTINETTYTDGDENGGTIFRVRVVDVKPLNETTNEDNNNNNESEENKGEEAATDSSAEQQSNNNNNNNSEERDREELTTPKPRDTETLEEFDNEIPKSQVETLRA